MQFNHYGGEAALLAADLINLPASATREQVERALLTRRVANPRLTDAQAVAVIDWGHQLSRCFDVDDIEQQCATVNELLSIAASKPCISLHDGHPPPALPVDDRRPGLTGARHHCRRSRLHGVFRRWSPAWMLRATRMWYRVRRQVAHRSATLLLRALCQHQRRSEAPSANVGSQLTARRLRTVRAVRTD